MAFKLFREKDVELETKFTFCPIDESLPDNSIQQITTPIPYEDEFLKTLPVSLFDYQLQALRWMHSKEQSSSIQKRGGGILADVMGLGKTIDGLSLILYDRYCIKRVGLEPEKVLQPTLIVASLTLVSNWSQESMGKFGIQRDDIVIYHGTSRKRKLCKYLSEKGYPLIILTTYQTIQTEYKSSIKGKDEATIDNIIDKDDDPTEGSPLFSLNLKRVILDEAHTVRNKRTKTTEALQSIKTCSLFCFTGTPIFNTTEDIITLSQLCSPCDKLGNYHV